jgi:DNA polymerase elongation subunit (family B)
VNAFVSSGRLVLLRRDEAGELRERKVRPEYSLFIRSVDLQKVERELRATAHLKYREEGNFTRVFFPDYDTRDRIVNGRTVGQQGWFRTVGVETFEADLSPVKRWLVDSGARVQKPLPGYLDLEWDSRVPFGEKERARILCWGLVRPGGDRIGGVLEADTDEAERELLLDLFFELTAVDQVLAWNGDAADFDLIKARCERLRINVDRRRWLWLDHMLLFKKFNLTASDSGDEKASAALGRVAESLGVRGKLDTMTGKRTWDEWIAGGERRERLGLYCVEDAATMLRIEEVTGYVSILATLAETCGVLPDSRGMRGVNFVESFLMRIGAKRGERAPTKVNFEGYDQGENQYKGAFVFESEKTGLHRDVHACDFARLYPSIMQAWNMSPETHRGSAVERLNRPLVGEVSAAEYFAATKAATLEAAIKVLEEDEAVCPLTLEIFRVGGARGLFAEALDEVTKQRAYWSKLKASLEPGSVEWKEADRKDSAYKIIANTFYGVAGSVFSRYHLRALGESVTQVGVWLIKATAAAGEAAGMTLVAGDTDSAFFTGCTESAFTSFVQHCNSVLYPSMIDPTGADSSRISLAFEKTLGLMINVAKKRYAGRLKHFKGKAAKDDTKLVIKGLEYKRGDTPRLARSLQQKLVELLLYYGKPLPDLYEVGPADVEALLEPWQRKILARDFDFADAIIAKSLTEPIEQYGRPRADGTPNPIPAHVQVARLLLERGEQVYVGAKIEYVVTDGSKSPQRTKPAIDVTIQDVDVFYLWEVLVYPPAGRVLEACFPNHNWRRWESVRPMRGVLPGQVGFGFGERSWTTQ